MMTVEQIKHAARNASDRAEAVWGKGWMRLDRLAQNDVIAACILFDAISAKADAEMLNVGELRAIYKYATRVTR